MSTGQSQDTTTKRLCIHPSVGMAVDPDRMTARQKVAAVAKVRYLEHDLFEGGKVRRGLDPRRADEIVISINELRRALGWLEIDIAGQLRWPAGTKSATSSR